MSILTPLDELAGSLYNALNLSDFQGTVALGSKYPADQRDKVLPLFIKKYGELPSDMIARLFKPPQKTILTYLWSQRHEVRAEILLNAIRASDYSTMMDLIFLSPRSDWESIRTHYTRMCGRQLDADLINSVKPGKKEAAPMWPTLAEAWLRGTRSERYNTSNESVQLVSAIKRKDFSAIIWMLTNTVPSEWEKIVAITEETFGSTLDEFFLSNLPYADCVAFSLGSSALINPSLGAAFAISRACFTNCDVKVREKETSKMERSASRPIKGTKKLKTGTIKLEEPRSSKKGAEHKGDVPRLIRISSLFFDSCNKCKFFYHKYGSLAADLRSGFASPLCDAFMRLWNVD